MPTVFANGRSIAGGTVRSLGIVRVLQQSPRHSLRVVCSSCFMWEVDNRTEFSVGKNWVRDEAGLHHWIVAVKGTFQVSRAGGLELAEEQPAPTLAPEYLGESGVSSLRCDSLREVA